MRLSGFPGPYAAYVYKTIHNSGILKLMEAAAKDMRSSSQLLLIVTKKPSVEPECFEGEVKGEITLAERKEQGKSGFGFDPIFQPNGSDKTFAEMTIEEKNRLLAQGDSDSQIRRMVHKTANLS